MIALPFFHMLSASLVTAKFRRQTRHEAAGMEMLFD